MHYEYISHAVANFDWSATKIIWELKAKPPILVRDPACEANPNQTAHLPSIGPRATITCTRGDPLETDRHINTPMLETQRYINCKPR